MSLHVIKPATEALLRFQRRHSFNSSAAVGLLTALLLLMLTFVLLSPLSQEAPAIITHQAETPPEEEPQPDRKISNSPECQPPLRRQWPG
jgi:hypothetical protein